MIETEIWVSFLLGMDECSMPCKAKYGINNELHDSFHCIEFNIDFYTNTTKPVKVTDILCNITLCIVENVTIECSIHGIKSDNGTDQINASGKNDDIGDGICLGKLLTSNFKSYHVFFK
jgi:hypothetical protein